MDTKLQKIRLVLCIGKSCNANHEADALFQRLEETLGEPSNFTCPKMIRWETANCLSWCDDGPNIAIFPAGEFFHHMTPQKLEPLIERFLALQKQE